VEALRAWARRPSSPLVLGAGTLCLVALFWTFWNLEGGDLEIFDGALMASLAREMIAAGKYGYTVDASGEYALRGFSKPPGALWLIVASLKTFGATLFALRLPSALACFGLALLALFWGRKLEPGRRGVLLGTVWGVLVLSCEGAVRYGGTICIEPIFAFWVALAIFAYAHRTWRGALIAGLALTAAFMTKQLGAGLAVFVVVGLEVSRFDRAAPRRSVRDGLVRLTAAGALPAAVAFLWLRWVEAVASEKAFGFMWRYSIKARVGGFQGTRHFNWMNRYTDLVEGVLQPVPLAVAALGLVLLAWIRRGRGGERFAWGLLGYALVSIAIFDLYSKSVLEWYAFHLVMPMTGGAAFLLTRGGWHLHRARRGRRVPIAAGALIGLGALVALGVVEGSVARVYSRAWVMLAVGVVFAVSAARAARTGRGRPLLVGVGVCLLVGLGARAARHPHLREGLNRDSSLMRILDDEGAQKVSVDRAMFNRGPKRPSRIITFFGTDAVKASAPWATQNEAGFDARVEVKAVPNELKPREGVRLRRGRGGVAYFGDLSQPPFAESAIEDALAKGPLTFEAEDVSGARSWTLARDRRASGGEARVAEPWLSEKLSGHMIAGVPKLRLPEGEYVAVFRVSWTCRDLAWRQHVLRMRAGDQKRDVHCTNNDDGSGGYTDIELPFRVKKEGEVPLKIEYKQAGARADKLEVWRADRRPR
jgi:4-amino-4-deoxy-L-arabinose transferase-like glycosyltransferase